MKKTLVLLQIGIAVVIFLCFTVKAKSVVDSGEQEIDLLFQELETKLKDELAREQSPLKEVDLDKPETKETEKVKVNPNARSNKPSGVKVKKGAVTDKLKAWGEAFLTKVKAVKAKYLSLPSLGQPKSFADILGNGLMVATHYNEKHESKVFGPFTGPIACINVVCQPVGVAKVILTVFAKIEQKLSGMKDSTKTFNDFLKKLKSLPMIGSAIKTTSTVIDTTVEPVLETVSSTASTTFLPIGWAKNSTVFIVNQCNYVKSSLLLMNLLMQTKPEETQAKETMYQASEYFKEECGAVLRILPTWGNIIKAIKDEEWPSNPPYVDDAVNGNNSQVIDLLTGEGQYASNLTNVDGNIAKRSSSYYDNAINAAKNIKGFGTVEVFSNFDPVLTLLKKVWSGFKVVAEKLDLFKPLIQFFNAVKRMVDVIMDFEMCIYLIPYGELLEESLEIANEVGDWIVGVASKISVGDLASNAAEIGDAFESFGSGIASQLSTVGAKVEAVVDEIGDGLESAGKAVYNGFVDASGNLVNAAGNYIDKAGNVITSGSTYKNIGNKIYNGIKKIGRKKRSVKERFLQSPNPEYYRKLNVTLTRELSRQDRSISGSMMNILSKYIAGGKICFTLRQIIDYIEALIDLIMKPIEKVVTKVLEPVMSQVQALIQKILPDMSFLTDFLDVSIGMMGVEDFINLGTIFTDDPQFKSMYETITNLKASCIETVNDFLQFESGTTITDVKCACMSGLGNCPAKREVSERSTTSTECRYSGLEYDGTLSVTNSGMTCQRWDVQTPHSHGLVDEDFVDLSLTMADNFCRNPGQSRKQPWCYTTNENTAWEYCDIPLCPKACLPTSTSKDVPGSLLSVTGSGIKCQSWDTDMPHSHSITADQLGVDNLGVAENFCRNPTGSNYGPFCFTTNNGIRKELCDVPYCDSYSTLKSTYKEYSYSDCTGNTIQTLSTANIKTCINTCSQTSNCVGFVYTTSSCLLKSTCNYNSFTYSNNNQVYLKTEAAGYQAYSGQTCTKTMDIKGQKAASVQECAEICKELVGCVGFVRDGELCTYKSRCVGQTAASGQTLYLKDGLKTYRQVSNRGCAGNDLYSKVTTDQEECDFICNRDPDCVAYLRQSALKKCWFKHTCDQLVVRPDTHTLYFKEDGRFTKYSDRTCWSTTYKSVNTYSAYTCAYECRKDPDCTSFVLLLNTGKCSLKYKCYINMGVLKENYDLYVMDQAPHFNRLEYKGCPGNDITGNQAVQNPAQCAEKCLVDPLCVAFDSNNNYCYLKHTCDTGNLIDRSNAHIHVKHRAILFDRYTSKDCAGNDITNMDRHTLEHCATKCYENALCESFFYRPSTATIGKCWLKLKCDTTALITNTNGDLYVKKAVVKYDRKLQSICGNNNIVVSYDKTADQCASDCTSNVECFGFQYRSDNHQCWLKSKCLPSQFTANSLIDVYWRTEIPGFKRYQRQICSEHTLQQEDTVTGIIQCASLCQRKPLCVGFSIHKTTFACDLKHNCHASILSTNNNYDTYVMQANRINTLQVATNQPAMQKSKQDGGYPWYGVDGNAGTDFSSDGCTKTNDNNEPWWSVFLGAARTIHFVTVVNRGDCCSERLKNFKVWGSNSPDPNSGSKTLCHYFTGTAPSGSSVVIKCNSPVTAKYLIIQRLGSSNILTVCEVGVFVADDHLYLEEVASGRPTTQSSTGSEDNRSGDSKYAVDGNKGQHYKNQRCTRTQKSNYPWWSVTLAEKRVVRYVTIYNRGDCCGGRLNKVEVKVGLSSNNINQATRCAYKSGTYSTDDIIVLECSTPILGKYVIIRINDTNEILTLCEVTVHAEK